MFDQGYFFSLKCVATLSVIFNLKLIYLAN